MLRYIGTRMVKVKNEVYCLKSYDKEWRPIAERWSGKSLNLGTSIWAVGRKLGEHIPTTSIILAVVLVATISLSFLQPRPMIVHKWALKPTTPHE